MQAGCGLEAALDLRGGCWVLQRCCQGWVASCSSPCGCRMVGGGWHSGLVDTGPGASVGWVPREWQLSVPGSSGPRSPGVGGPRSGRTRWGQAICLKPGRSQAARRVVPGHTGCPSPTHVGVCSVHHRKRGGHGHQGEVAMSKRLPQGHPEAVPREEPGHPAGG